MKFDLLKAIRERGMTQRKVTRRIREDESESEPPLA